MYPKTLQYLIGYSDISVTMNTYTNLGLEDAAEEWAGCRRLKTPGKSRKSRRANGKRQR